MSRQRIEPFVGQRSRIGVRFGRGMQANLSTPVPTRAAQKQTKRWKVHQPRVSRSKKTDRRRDSGSGESPSKTLCEMSFDERDSKRRDASPRQHCSHKMWFTRSANDSDLETLDQFRNQLGHTGDKLHVLMSVEMCRSHSVIKHPFDLQTQLAQDRGTKSISLDSQPPKHGPDPGKASLVVQQFQGVRVSRQRASLGEVQVNPQIERQRAIPELRASRRRGKRIGPTFRLQNQPRRTSVPRRRSIRQ